MTTTPCCGHCHVLFFNRSVVGSSSSNNLESSAIRCYWLQAFRFPPNNPNGTKAEWVESPSHGIPAPTCMETEFSRDNHLGNGVNGYPNLFNWTIPASAVGEQCAMRIR